MRVIKKTNLFLVIYISIFLPILSTFVIYSNIERFQQNTLSYSNDDDDNECAVIEVGNKNFNKLAITKIPAKIRQGTVVIERSHQLVLTTTKNSSQLSQPLRC